MMENLSKYGFCKILLLLYEVEILYDYLDIWYPQPLPLLHKTESLNRFYRQFSQTGSSHSPSSRIDEFHQTLNDLFIALDEAIYYRLLPHYGLIDISFIPIKGYVLIYYRPMEDNDGIDIK